MQKELKKSIGRFITSLLFWGMFALYANLKGLEINAVETFILFSASAVFMPYIIRWVHETLK